MLKQVLMLKWQGNQVIITKFVTRNINVDYNYLFEIQFVVSKIHSFQIIVKILTDE